MLTNGYFIEGKKNVVCGDCFSVCHNCAAEWASKNKKSYAEGCNEVRGKNTGEEMKIFPALKDPNGEKVHLCKKCIEKFMEDLS